MRAMRKLIAALLLTSIMFAGCGKDEPTDEEKTRAHTSVAIPSMGDRGPRKVLRVSTAREFIDAIGPDITIVMAAGDYDLTKLSRNETKHIAWRKVFDGYNVVIRDVGNLHITGAIAGKTRILVQPAYANVLIFENITGVSMERVELAHSPIKGFSTGGVIAIDGGQNISIEDCVLSGGTEGLTLNKVRNMRLADSTIKNCSYGILTAESCKGVGFVRNNFTNNREFHGLLISNSSNITFEACTIRGNKLLYRDYPLFATIASSDILVRDCRITGNFYNDLIWKKDSVRFVDTTFEGNKKSDEYKSWDFPPPTPMGK